MKTTANPAHLEPSPALTAARALAQHGNHVHYVADSEIRCLSRHCRRRGRPTTALNRHGLL